MSRFSFLILLVAVLAACGPGARDPAASATPGPTADETGNVAILFQRSGGLAGITEQWAIYPDGRVVTGEGQEFTVTAAQISDLLTQITARGFFELADSYGLGGDCRDCFTYMVTINDQEKVKALTAVDGAIETPEQVMDIIGLINDLVSSLAQP